jgi:di/tricarboxylate transporter
MKKIFLALSVFFSVPLFASMEPISFIWSWQVIVVISLFAVTFTLLFIEVFPAHLTLLASAILLLIIGIVEPKEFIRGFTKEVIFTLGFLFIIARTLEINGILDLISPLVLPKSKWHVSQLCRLLFPLAGASAFLNNTPIVLLFTPLIRNWAIEGGRYPSKFLIPISYAAILGGVCTLIGTSVNLVVDGLLRELDLGESIHFFDLAWVGLPCAIIGIFFIATIGYHLLPKRKDPKGLLESHTKEISAEFSLQEKCELNNKTIKEVSAIYFKGSQVIEILRNKHAIDAPTSQERLQENDHLVFLGNVEQITALHSIDGLVSITDPTFSLHSSSLNYTEVVVSFTSSLVGKTLSKVSFRKNYGASVMAIFRAGYLLRGKLSEISLHAGDTLMLLSSEEHFSIERCYNDFYVTTIQKAPAKASFKKLIIPLLLLVGMIFAFLKGVPLLYASFGAATCSFVLKKISFKEMKKAVQWNILIIIASAYVLGQGIMVTGLADGIAQGIVPLLGTNPYFLIGGILLLTLLFTEVITNSAAALLVFPIGIEVISLAGYQTPIAYKAVAIAVAIGASSSFITPIGYQTNTIVYGPGGYRFFDYVKVGLPLTALVWLVATMIIPNVWAF